MALSDADVQKQVKKLLKTVKIDGRFENFLKTSYNLLSSQILIAKSYLLSTIF